MMLPFKLNAPFAKVALSTFGILSALALSSCQDEDYGFTSDEVRAAAYAKNFESMYGTIDENQVWDFSSYNLKKLGLAGGPSAATRGEAPLTRAEISGLVTKYNTDDTKWYTVSGKTINWLNQHLEEKKNNTKYVSSFDWEKSQVGDVHPLYVIPIYQGQTGMIWNLELIDLDYSTSTIIWSKSENFQYQENFGMWDEFFYESYKSGQAPYENSKFTKLKFADPLAKVPSTFTDSDDIIAAFSVTKNKNVGRESEVGDIFGSFYIKIPGESNLVKITRTTGETGTDAFFSQAASDGVLDSDNIFVFKSSKNTDLGLNDAGTFRNLTSGSPNKVYLNKLLGKEISGHTITVDDLKTIEFRIDDSFNYPTDGEGNKDHSYTFYTWSPERIRVFVKYADNNTKTVKLTDVDENSEYVGRHTINKFNVQTRPIMVDLTKLPGTHFAFNLKTTKRGSGDSDLSDLGDDHRSDKGFMSQINDFSELGSPIDPTALKTALADFNINLGDHFEYMVVGCEDAGYNGKNSDQDYNDLVLLLVGETLPNQTIKKRYMVEDLGSYLDFDFNDIVVDVTETVARTNAGKEYTQTAAIRHLRGTIPFRVTIGNKAFGTGKIMRGHNTGAKSYDPSTVESIKANYIWKTTYTVDESHSLSTLREEYWNPDANNIKVEVWPNFNSENKDLNDVYWNRDDATGKEINSDADGFNVQYRKIVEFPKKGTVPYIIATNQDVDWMEENNSIPENWIATRPDKFNNGFDQTPSVDETTGGGSSDPNRITNPTSVSDGIITLNGSVNSSSVYIPASKFNDVYFGDIIIVHVNGATLYDNSRLVFKNPSDGSTIDDIGTDGGVVATGDYMLVVKSQDVLNALQRDGLRIEGQNATITKVTVSSPAGAIVANGNDIAESAFKLSNQRTVIRSASNAVTLSNSDLQKLYVGDQIVVHVDNLRADSYLGFKTNRSGWPNIIYHGGLGDKGQGDVNVTGDIVLTVNADNVEAIKNGNGLVINGKYTTITSVDVKGAELLSSKTPSLAQGSIVLPDHSKVLNDYDDNVVISGTDLDKLYVGDKIIINVSNLRKDSQIGFHTSDWEKLITNSSDYPITTGIGDIYSWNNYPVTGDITIEVTAALKSTGGIVINGQHINVVGVSVVPDRSTTATNVTNPTMISGGTSIYSTRQVINYYDGFSIEASKFPGLQVGDQIVVHVDNVRTNSALGLRTFNRATPLPGFGQGDSGNEYSIPGDMALTVSSDNIEEITTNGLGITGAYINVTGVSIIYGPRTLLNADTQVAHNKAYSGLSSGGAYYQTLTDNLSKYSKLTVYFNQTSGGTINFFSKDTEARDGKWNSLQNGIATNDKTSYTFDLTDERKTAIEDLSGLIIQYYNEGNTSETITLTKIVLHN